MHWGQRTFFPIAFNASKTTNVLGATANKPLRVKAWNSSSWLYCYLCMCKLKNKGWSTTCAKSRKAPSRSILTLYINFQKTQHPIFIKLSQIDRSTSFTYIFRHQNHINIPKLRILHHNSLISLDRLWWHLRELHRFLFSLHPKMLMFHDEIGQVEYKRTV